MAQRRNPHLQRALASAALGVLALLARIPLGVARAVSSPVATMVYLLVPRVRRIGMENLDLAYGESLSRTEKKRILRGAVHNMVRVAVELPWVGRLKEPAMAGLVEVRGLEHIDSTRGGILIGAHLGNWEWMAATLSMHGYPISEVVRPFDDPRLNAAVDGIRRSGGVGTIPKAGAGRELIARLRAGELVGILVDQSPRRNGAPAKFFGRDCWATIGAAMAAARTKLPVYPISMVRRPDGGYLFEAHPPLHMSESGHLRTDLSANTQLCQDAVEKIVRNHPEQWLWFHRRWRQRPSLEKEWHRTEPKRAMPEDAGSQNADKPAPPQTEE